MNRYWVSWWGAGAFEYDGPWWVSGAREWVNATAESDEWQPSICAAVLAEDEDQARSIIAHAHDNEDTPIEWRFTNRREDNWAPFCERFPRADWMQWPCAENGWKVTR